MRFCFAIPVAGVAALLAGCAAEQAPRDVQLHRVPPLASELIRIEKKAEIVPAKVGVEDLPGEARRFVLIPDYEVPEPTPEEREILGLDEGPEPFNWLEFYVAQPERVRVWPRAGGVSTAVSGSGGATVSTGPVQPSASRGPGVGGVTVGTWSWPKTISAARPWATERTAEVGPGEAGATVGYGLRKEIATHAKRADE